MRRFCIWLLMIWLMIAHLTAQKTPTKNPPAQQTSTVQETHKGKNTGITELRGAISRIKSSDPNLANQLNTLAQELESALHSGNKDAASKALHSIASSIFDAQDHASKEALMQGLAAVVKIQKANNLADETKEESNKCCSGKFGHGECKEQKNAKCYTIVGKDGCLGTECAAAKKK